jgi:hypothetical protein
MLFHIASDSGIKSFGITKRSKIWPAVQQKLWDFAAMTDMEGVGEEGEVLGNTFDILR